MILKRRCSWCGRDIEIEVDRLPEIHEKVFCKICKEMRIEEEDYIE